MAIFRDLGSVIAGPVSQLPGKAKPIYSITTPYGPADRPISEVAGSDQRVPAAEVGHQSARVPSRVARPRPAAISAAAKSRAINWLEEDCIAVGAPPN